jgi:hypothetical protein
MEGFSISSSDNQIVITIDRSLVDINLVNDLVARLKLEQLIKKANFAEKILNIAGEINKEWWGKNKKSYLRIMQGY